jgi:hypothetical protein
MRWIGTLVVLAACHDGGGAMVDGPAGTPDTSAATPGVFVSWNAQVPGTIAVSTAQIRVATAELSIGLFELVSPQGDVQSQRFDLAWQDGAAPDQTVFHDAPPGEYQLAKLKLDGSDHAVEIRGTWTVAGVSKTFKIETKAPFPTKQIPFSRTLEAGGQLPIGVQLDLTPALSVVDFAALPVRRASNNDQGEDDDLRLEDDNPVQMMKFRAGLLAGIQLAN